MEINVIKPVITISLSLLLSLPTASAKTINQDVAKSYNDGVVRCGNAECARYLYACFQSYSGATLEEFMACASLASKLNGSQKVVTAPERTG